MKVISYGNGNSFDKEKWNDIINCHFKPKGGLWTSPIDSKYGWKNWCQDNEFGDLSEYFELEISGVICTINSVYDLQKLPILRNKEFWPYNYIDFQLMKRNGIDAIHLTEKGERTTRFTMWDDCDVSLYGWDCETVFIMNKDCIM